MSGSDVAYRPLIKGLTASERPRECLMTSGADQLFNAELLAIILRTGTPSDSVLNLTTRLLARFDGLGSLARGGFNELCAERGNGGSQSRPGAREEDPFPPVRRADHLNVARGRGQLAPDGNGLSGAGRVPGGHTQHQEPSASSVQGLSGHRKHIRGPGERGLSGGREAEYATVRIITPSSITTTGTSTCQPTWCINR